MTSTTGGGSDRCLLVLNNKPLDQRPLRAWLGPRPRLVMVTSRDVAARGRPDQLSGYDAVETVEDYTDTRVLEGLAVALGRRHQATHIVSCQEDDVIRAARIRHELGLPGQSLQSAVAYRDKLRMRQHAAAASIRQPAFAAAASIRDVRAFIDRHGLPVAIKPRLGSGSRGIWFLHDKTQLAALPEGLFTRSGLGGWLIEAFITAPFCHIDGITAHGTVIYAWPSTYTTGNAEAVHAGTPLISVMHDPGDPAFTTLTDLTSRVHVALPAPPVPTGFHLEAWLPAGHDPILCEVAARPTGPPIAETFQRAFGAHLIAEHIRGQADTPLHLTSQPGRPATHLGCVRLLRGHGTFTPPPPCPLPGTRLRVTLPAGTTGNGARHAADRAAHAIIEGTTSTQVHARIHDFTTWWTAMHPWRT